MMIDIAIDGPFVSSNSTLLNALICNTLCRQLEDFLVLVGEYASSQAESTTMPNSCRVAWNGKFRYP